MKESLERISIVSNVKVFRIRLIDDKKRDDIFITNYY